jgi:hypothetical protein
VCVPQSAESPQTVVAEVGYMLAEWVSTEVEGTLGASPLPHPDDASPGTVRRRIRMVPDAQSLVIAAR